MPKNTLTTEDVLRIKIMGRFGLPQKDIAELLGSSACQVSSIIRGGRHKNVKVDWYFYTTVPDPRPHDQNHLKTLKHERFAAGPCLACGRMLVDGVGDELIYIVRTEDGKDGFLCKIEKCQRKLLQDDDG